MVLHHFKLDFEVLPCIFTRSLVKNGGNLLADTECVELQAGLALIFFCIFPSVVFFIPREQQVALAILNHRSEQKYLLFFSFG